MKLNLKPLFIMALTSFCLIGCDGSDSEYDYKDTKPANADMCTNCGTNEHNVYCVGFNSALMHLVGGDSMSQTAAAQGTAYLRSIGGGLYGEKALEFMARGIKAFNDMCQPNMENQSCQNMIKKCFPISDRASKAFM